MRRLRVVQWSSGGVGAIALRAIAERPDLELAGVFVHSAAKAGRDAGALAGGARLGVAATGDAEALLALAPDCVCYTAVGESRPRECIDDFCRMLGAGVNVVTTSVPGLVHPAAFDPVHVARLEEACAKGGATLYASGIEPGFAGDQLVLTLATLVHKIRSVRTQEIFGYADYPVAFTMFEVFGFGKPPEERCIMELPGIQASSWGPPVRMVADRLGVRLDALHERYEKRVTERRLEVAAGVIEAGTVGAVRFETIGVVDGRDAIVIEHVNRMAPDVAPDWPTAARDGTYRIAFDGEPNLRCELSLGGPSDFSAHGMIATALRVVNAIPYVCEAPPGLVTSADLPPTLPRHAFEGARGEGEARGSRYDPASPLDPRSEPQASEGEARAAAHDHASAPDPRSEPQASEGEARGSRYDPASPLDPRSEPQANEGEARAAAHDHASAPDPRSEPKASEGD